MKRAAAVIVCLAVRFAVAGGQAGCGSGTLGGNAGNPPTSGIGGGVVVGPGMAGRGTGGNVAVGTGGNIVVGTGGFAGSVGGDIGPPPGGRGGAAGVAGFTAGTGGRGRGGVSGTGAFGGEFGTGGTGVGCQYIVPNPPVCGGGLCGNGAVDSCLAPVPVGCRPLMFSEDCDGTDFGSDSCAARGYASGNLICHADCTVDATRCSPCVPGPSTLRCGPAPITSTESAGFALAATDSEVAYAMITQGSTGSLSFARLSPNLDVTSLTVVDDTTNAGPLYGAILYRVAVAPLASGWVVAVCTDSEIYIHAFNANGQDAGRTTVASIATNDLCYGDGPRLAARPGGEVLLAWQTYDAGVSATVIAADGRSMTQPQTLVATDLQAFDVLAGAWIGDAFYVGVPIYPGAPADTSVESLRIMRVTTDGEVSTFGDDFSGLEGAPSFAAGADDLRAVYLGIPPGGTDSVIWQRVASNHTELAPVTLATYPSYWQRSPAVAFGDDTVVLLSGGDQQGLALARVALDGSIVTPAYGIVAGPNYSVSGADMVRRGPDVIVGWFDTGADYRIDLARLTP